MKTMKIKSRDELHRITERDLDIKFDRLNSKQQSIALIRFYIREVWNLLKSPISEDDLDAGIVDGKDDLGCDFIHRDNSHNLIIQAKYRKSGAQESVEEISHFQSILKRFRNPEIKPNKHLREILSEIDWTNDTFEMIFITFGQISPTTRRITEQSPGYPESIPDLNQRCDWVFWAEEDINTEIRSARRLSQGVTDKTIELFAEGDTGNRGASSIIETTSGNYKSYIMSLDARQLLRCYEELGRDAIFSLNIRNFIGNTATNKNIITTASREPEKFFLYNNGISCLASKVEISKASLKVSGLQVINGAQTVKALVNIQTQARRLEKNPWEKEVPKILVRVTEIPEGYGQSGETREKITQYNNTQNTIKISDFRSNDSIQKSVGRLFSEFTRNGRKVFYLSKRTDRVPNNSEVIKLEEYAKSVYAFLFDPTDFSTSSSFLFSAEPESGYVRVFGDGQSVWEEMPQAEFRLRAGAYWLAQEFAGYMKQDREKESDADSRAALERKWLVVYAAGCVLKAKFKGEKWKEVVSKLYKGDWVIGKEKTGEMMVKLFNAAKSGVVHSYKSAKKYDVNFGHRNWMRSKSTTSSINDTLKDVVLPNLVGFEDIV